MKKKPKIEEIPQEWIAGRPSEWFHGWRTPILDDEKRHLAEVVGRTRAESLYRAKLLAAAPRLLNFVKFLALDLVGKDDLVPTARDLVDKLK